MILFHQDGNGVSWRTRAEGGMMYGDGWKRAGKWAEIGANLRDFRGENRRPVAGLCWIFDPDLTLHYLGREDPQIR